MAMRYTMQEMVDLAKKADEEIEVLVKVAATLDEFRESLESQRRSSDEEKARIDEVLNAMNGEVTVETSSAAIITKAGVRKCQGTSSYAKHAIKRMLLTYKKS